MSSKLSLYKQFQLYVNYALGLPLALLLGRGREFRFFVLNWKKCQENRKHSESSCVLEEVEVDCTAEMERVDRGGTNR